MEGLTRRKCQFVQAVIGGTNCYCNRETSSGLEFCPVHDDSARINQFVSKVRALPDEKKTRVIRLLESFVEELSENSKS